MDEEILKTASLKVVHNGKVTNSDYAVTRDNFRKSRKKLLRSMNKGDYLVIELHGETEREILARQILKKHTHRRVL